MSNIRAGSNYCAFWRLSCNLAIGARTFSDADYDLQSVRCDRLIGHATGAPVCQVPFRDELARLFFVSKHPMRIESVRQREAAKRWISGPSGAPSSKPGGSQSAASQEKTHQRSAQLVGAAPTATAVAQLIAGPTLAGFSIGDIAAFGNVTFSACRPFLFVRPAARCPPRMLDGMIAKWRRAPKQSQGRRQRGDRER